MALSFPSFRSSRPRRSRPTRQSPRAPFRAKKAAGPAQAAAPHRRRLMPLARPALDRAPKARLAMVWGLLLLAMLGLALNLFRIQVIQASTLSDRAESQHRVMFNPVTPRRPIIDRNGDVLAIDRPVYTLYAHPYMFKESKEEMAAALAPVLSQPVDALLKLFNSADSGIRVQESIPEDLAHRIERLGKDGLDMEPHQQRLYPQENLFANIVGYVNLDRQGQAGLEASQEKELQQPIEGMQLNRSGDGSIIPVGLPPNFLESQKTDLRMQLTVDSRLQRATRFALKDMMKRYSAKRGTVIVMNVQDGSIVSLVSEPSYDPNKFYEANLERLKDWVITDLYEPGSTFKPVNIAIALESGAIHPDSTVYDEGSLQIDGWPIFNSDSESAGARGDLSITEVLKYSSNVGMVHVMERLDPGLYYGWLERVGLNKPTGIDLPVETAGQMKTYRQFIGSPIEPATAAFGQGFSLTPMKLIQLHSMVANGGKLVTPHVVKGLVDANGKVQWRPNTPLPKPLFSPKNTKAVLGMMEQVVAEGTGKAAQINGYRVAGKTGTAQKASANGGYIEGARITSFVGVLPAEAPRYAVLAVVDEPQGEDAYGGTVAAPIVKSVMETLITTEQIQPSRPEALPEPELSQPDASLDQPDADDQLQDYEEAW
jgi:cell division protein FtsI (penicillin-binding protein 3)